MIAWMNHAAQAGVDRNPKRVEAEEAQILERADLVTVTSQRLFELKRAKNRNTHLVLNAGDVELFAQPRHGTPEAMGEIMRPIIGMVGALDAYKIDFELLVAMAKRKPTWQFVFVGSPVVDRGSRELQALRGLKNTHFVGAVPRREVPQYVYQFDVCLIPYRSSRYNEASFPLKFWEFMATGKPVVATGVPELQAYADRIGYAADVDEAVAALERLVAGKDAVGPRRRKELASEHTFEARVRKIMALVEDAGTA